MTSRLADVYAIVDADLSADPLALGRRAVAAGCRIVQLRAKHLDDRSSTELAVELRALCKKAGAAFVMNDRADIARIVKADGLHLGQDDLSIGDARKVVGDMRIGVSTHDFEQAARAESEGADLIAFGPVFETKSKQNPDPVLGVASLAEVCRRVSRPVVAIGGITPQNAGETFDAGARYIAVISALPSFLGDR